MATRRLLPTWRVIALSFISLGQKMNIKQSERDRNEQLVRHLYHLAEATSKDTRQFIFLFAEGGYFMMWPATKNTMGTTGAALRH